MDIKSQNECIETTQMLRDKIADMCVKLNTSPQQVRLAKFADALSALLDIKCTFGDLPIMPIFQKNKLSFVAVTKKRPKLTFKVLGISVGDKIEFTRSPDIVAVVSDADKNKVSLIIGNKIDKEIQSLSPLTKKLLNLKFAPQPSPYWKFNGKTLLSLYNKAYPLA